MGRHGTDPCTYQTRKFWGSKCKQYVIEVCKTAFSAVWSNLERGILHFCLVCRCAIALDGENPVQFGHFFPWKNDQTFPLQRHRNRRNC